MNNMKSQIPVIMLDQSTAPAFSVFNPNDWGRNSKLIVQSCAANYGLLIYAVARIKNIFSQADGLCLSRFNDLKAQWKMSRWNLSSCIYLVDIPEAHLSIHSFLSTVKTFLDVFAQLISSEGIVHDKIHGFHKKGENVGGRLLHILSNNAVKSKKQVATLLHDLICHHKLIWIDHAVNNRDFFIHPENGLSKVMFALELDEVDGELKLIKIIKPSFDNEDFDAYVGKTLSRVDEFSKKYLEYLKSPQQHSQEECGIKLPHPLASPLSDHITGRRST